MANPWTAEIARINNLIQTTQRNIARDQNLLLANPNSPDAGRLQQQIASGENYIIDLRVQLAQFTDQYNSYEGRTVLARPVDPAVETGTNEPVRTIEQTQATSAQNGINVGIPLPDETGAVGSIRRNPETGELYDAGGLQAPTQGGVGAGTATNSGRSINSDNNPTPTGTSNQASISTSTAALNKLIPTQPNQLDQYSSYTYNIGWYLLTPQQFNAMQRSQKPSAAGWQLLMQSGGAPIAGRSPAFPLDYYMDDLEIDTRIPGGGSNLANTATDIRFKVVEPNGITLIENLFRAVVSAYGRAQQPQATTTNNGASAATAPVTNQTPNYIAAFYCLVISFYGYDKDGNIVAPVKGGFNTAAGYGKTDVITKYYPFRITDIKFTVANRAIEYTITAKPQTYSLHATTDRGTVPFPFVMTGQTVQQLLTGSPVGTTYGTNQADPAARQDQPAPPVNAAVAAQVVIDQSNAGVDANGNFTGDTTSPFNIVAP